MKIYSYVPFDYEADFIAFIKVEINEGKPSIEIPGITESMKKKSIKIIRSAIESSGFDFPQKQILINLTPPAIKKDIIYLNFAVALGILQESFKTETDVEEILIIGMMETTGRIRSVRGAYNAAMIAKKMGINKCIMPTVYANKIREIEEMYVFGAMSLSDAFIALSNPGVFKNKYCEKQSMFISQDRDEIDGVHFPRTIQDYFFGKLQSNKSLMRGLQIAAAGGHNLMAVGPMDCGKTVALRNFPALLPTLTAIESQSVTRIYSLAGMLPKKDVPIFVPPFRVPDNIISVENMFGGGHYLLPGEVSLAHNGVLLLEDAAEFRSSVLHALSAPLKNGNIALRRAGRQTVYPSSFQLLTSMIPCPCGNYGNKNRPCLCSRKSRELYWKKITRSLVDMTEIRIFINNKDDKNENKADDINTLRVEIARAVKTQRARQNCRNAKLSNLNLLTIIKNEKNIVSDVNYVKEKKDMNTWLSILKVALTISDMEGANVIDERHIAEAISYRKQNFIVEDIDFYDEMENNKQNILKQN